MPVAEFPLYEAETDDDDCLIIYTDCAHHVEYDADGARRHVMKGAINVYDQRSGESFCWYDEVPQEYIHDFLSSDDDTLIYQGELAFAIGAIFTKPNLFRERKVIHFVDNTAALSAMINGYARKPEAARMVCLFHLALMATHCEWYGEWCPSKANLADIMTRPDRWESELKSIIPDVQLHEGVQLPPLGMSVPDMKAWLINLRNKAADDTGG